MKVRAAGVALARFIDAVSVDAAEAPSGGVLSPTLPPGR